ncbi:MAG: hypothetical protein ACT4OL_12740 [Nitrospiraceae bacterium]
MANGVGVKMTAAFEELLKTDLENLQRDLLKEVNEGRLSARDVEDILSLFPGLHFPGLHFPGLMTLLALGAGKSRRKRRVTPFPLTKQNIADAFARLSTKDENVKQAVRLLLTGQFFGDMADAFATISHTVPGLPLDIAQDFRSLPHLPRRLVLAIKRDLGDAPSTIESVITDLREHGMINSQPKILGNTIGVLYRQATAKQVAKTIHSLLGNESVRLAIIVFARSKGLNISQEDLDQLRKAIDPDGPNLGELLAPGYRQLREQVGKAQAMELLDQFVA